MLNCSSCESRTGRNVTCDPDPPFIQRLDVLTNDFDLNASHAAYARISRTFIKAADAEHICMLFDGNMSTAVNVEKSLKFSSRLTAL
ncbi:hypothetical protein RB195_017528 [Necator americanus]|uniref:Uncharacterized protein n=1 Tax=Necator americanus TaxID=51031 RepID=A0ABR1C5N4_NECAM